MVKNNSENQTADKLIELTPEKLKKLQTKGLEILLYFKDFCEKHDLIFCFCGGCCIGAIRHKGFIPWDDDVDVFMPREDYEKLGELWNKYADTKQYSYNRTTENKFVGHIMTTITDNSTNVIRPWQKGKYGHKGVMMDVLPLDGCAPSRIKRKIQMMWSMIYSLYCSQIVPVNHGKIMKFACKILLAVVPSNKLKFKLWKFAEKQMSKYKISNSEYITELCAGPGYMKNKYPKEIFKKAVYKEFEGHMMPLPIGYDTYLKIAFGDYMSLPPKEKQVPHHDIMYMDF